MSGEVLCPDPEVLAHLFGRRLIEESGCWVWTAGRTADGYGIVRIPGDKRPQYVHRVAHELFIGAIPDGYQVDHLCSNRPCWNPDHLEAVTGRENTARSRNVASISIRTNHCQRGHELTEANVYVPPGDGRRRCRPCFNLRDRARRARATA